MCCALVLPVRRTSYRLRKYWSRLWSRLESSCLDFLTLKPISAVRTGKKLRSLDCCYCLQVCCQTGFYQTTRLRSRRNTNLPQQRWCLRSTSGHSFSVWSTQSWSASSGTLYNTAGTTHCSQSIWCQCQFSPLLAKSSYTAWSNSSSNISYPSSSQPEKSSPSDSLYFTSTTSPVTNRSLESF